MLNGMKAETGPAPVAFGPRQPMPDDGTAQRRGCKMEKQVERLIDAMGVDQLLHTIALVCSDKAEYIRANWQDNALAQLWDKKASQVTNLANKVQS